MCLYQLILQLQYSPLNDFYSVSSQALTVEEVCVWKQLRQGISNLLRTDYHPITNKTGVLWPGERIKGSLPSATCESFSAEIFMMSCEKECSSHWSKRGAIFKTTTSINPLFYILPPELLFKQRK